MSGIIEMRSEAQIVFDSLKSSENPDEAQYWGFVSGYCAEKSLDSAQMYINAVTFILPNLDPDKSASFINGFIEGSVSECTMNAADVSFDQRVFLTSSAYKVAFGTYPTATYDSQTGQYRVNFI